MPHPTHPPCSHHSILVGSTNHEAPHYVIFSTPVTLSNSGPNISLSTLLSNTLSLCSTFSVQTNLHTHTKQLHIF
jgi:hypothetical protein